MRDFWCYVSWNLVICIQTQPATTECWAQNKPEPNPFLTHMNKQETTKDQSVSCIRGSGVPKNCGVESGAPQWTELSKRCVIWGHCLYTLTHYKLESKSHFLAALNGSHHNSFLHQSCQWLYPGTSLEIMSYLCQNLDINSDEMPAYQDRNSRRHSLFAIRALYSEQNILNMQLNVKLLRRKKQAGIS